MTERAERLAKYLESHGWVVFDSKDTKYCVCDPNLTHEKDANFCFSCGAVLKDAILEKVQILHELEAAIIHALGE